MALLTAIAPLVWQCNFIPLLARTMTTAIASPVPIICGFVSESMQLPEDCDSVTEMETMVVASVDTNTLQVLGRAVASLPHADQLINELVPRCQWLRSARRVSNDMCEDTRPFELLTQSAAMQVYSAMEDLLHYMTWLINSTRRHVPSAPEFISEFVDRVHPDHQTFARRFAESPIFVRLIPAFADADPPDPREEGVYQDKPL